MKNYLTKYLFFILVLGFPIQLLHAQLFSSDTALILMGTSFKLQAIATDRSQARNAVEAGVAEIQRIEHLISSHRDDSETTLINNNAGIKPVNVSEELFQLIVRSKKVSELTQGAYDISFLPLYHVWKFRGGEEQMPPADSISYYKKLVNWQNILTDQTKQTVYLRVKGMSIGFGSIGKGYAANQAKKVMMAHGAQSGFVNASGDILFWGKPMDKEKWTVAIKHPVQKGSYLGKLEVGNMAVVTSGDYENYLFIDGIKYAHIIDPRTGYPIQHVRSVTVVCPDAEVADALATSVAILGKEEGIRLIDRLKDVECLLIDDTGEMFHSKNLVLTK